MAEVENIAPPVLILASRGSQGSFLASLLGAHPALVAAPHLNLLPFEECWQYLTYCTVPRDTNLHGTLRFIAQQLLGEQTMQSVQAARRWMNIRREAPIEQVYAEIANLVAPGRLVDYSPLHAQNLEVMRRVTGKLPEAPVIHLVANPKTQAETLCPAVWQTINRSLGFWSEWGANHPCMDPYEIGEQLVDWSTHPPVFDPQFAWYRTQNAARQLFCELPEERAIRVSAEDLLGDPAAVLQTVLPRLGLECDAGIIRTMLGDQDTCFTRPGPFASALGVDYEMVGKSVADVAGRALPTQVIDRQAPLVWRGDADVFMPEVVDLAAEFGYAVGQS